jgi:hypothetical protein
MTRLWKIAAALLTLLLSAQPMKVGRSVSILTSNLIPYIGDTGTALVHSSVVESRWTPQSDRYEQGLISIRVISSLGHLKLKADENLQVAGRRTADRIVRNKDNRNLWNALAFQKGDQLLLALQRPVSGQNAWTAMAAWPVTGVDDPAIGGLKRSIEAQNAPESKRIEYLPALIGASDGISRNYVMMNLRKRTVATRQQAAAIISKAFLNASSESVRLLIAAEMCGRSYLVPEEGPEPGNAAIVAALLQALSTDPSAQSRANWASYLAASIGSKLDPDPAKEESLRSKYAERISDPPRGKAGLALRAAAAANPADERLEKLAKAWGY